MRNLEMENLGMEWQLLINTFSFPVLSLSLPRCSSSVCRLSKPFPGCCLFSLCSCWNSRPVTTFRHIPMQKAKGDSAKMVSLLWTEPSRGPSSVRFYCQSCAAWQSAGVERVEVDRQLAVPIIASKVHAYPTHQYLNTTYQLYNPIYNF